MADSVTITANVIDGTTVTGNVADGTTVTANVSEGTTVTANVVTGAPGTDGIMSSIVAGTNVTVNSADPANPVISVPGLVTDHGGLTGLADDDHTQYHTDARGDVRYYTKSQVDTSLASKEAVITAGTTGQYYRGDKTFQTLDKTAVGLANVDNTSDATKNSAVATLTNKTLTVPVIDQLGTASGLGAAWIAWTPTWTNLTIGNATVNARYKQIGKTVHATISVVFGTTTTVAGDIVFSLPVTRATYGGTGTITPIGPATMFDTSAGMVIEAVVTNDTTTTGRIRLFTASGTYSQVGTASGTVPFTWAASDEIGATFTYEAA